MVPPHTNTPSAAPVDRVTEVVKRAETQVNDPRFREEFRAELEQMKFTREELEELQRQLEASDVLRNKAEAREAILEQMRMQRLSLMESIVEKGKQIVDTSTWTPEQKKWGTIALIGTGVTAGLLLAKWLWDKTKKPREYVAEKTKSVWGFIKFAAIAASLTAAGYVGWHLYNKYYENYRQLRALDKEIRNLKTQAEDAAGKAKEELEARIAQLEEAKRKIEESNNAQSPAATAQSAAAPAVPEVMPEAVRGQALSTVVTHGIVSFFEWDGWTLNQEAKYAQVKGLLENNRHLKMGDVFASANEANGDVVMTNNPFAIAESDAENREKSAEYMLRFCVAFRDQVCEYLAKRENLTPEEAAKRVENMTLEEFVKEATASYTSIVPIVEAFDQGGSIEEAMRNLDLRKITNGDTGVQQELELFLAEETGLTEDELAGIGSHELLQALFLYGTGGSVADKLLKAPAGTEGAEELVIRKILEKLQSSDTHLYLLPCFHGLLPTDEDKSPEETVRTYLLDRMPAEQAVRFYLYRRMVDHGNPMGLILMQTEVIKFIADTEYFGIDKYRVCMQLMKKIAGNGTGDVIEQWKKMNIDVTPELSENAEKGLKLIGQAAIAAPLKGGWESMNFMAALGMEFPLTLAAGAEGHRLYRIYRINPHTVAVGMDEWAGELAGRPLSNAVRNRLPFLLTPEDIQTSAAQYKLLYERINNVTDATVKAKLQTLLRRCLNAPLDMKRWTELKSALSNEAVMALVDGDEAARAAGMFESSRGMRSAINIQRFGGPGGILRRFSRGYETIRQPIVDQLFQRPFDPQPTNVERVPGASAIDATAPETPESGPRIAPDTIDRAPRVETLPELTAQESAARTADQGGPALRLNPETVPVPTARPNLRIVQPDEIAESIDDVSDLKRELTAARASGDEKTFGTLLTEHRAMLEASAETDREAKALLKGMQLAESGKWRARIGAGGSGLFVILDVAQLYLNEQDLALALKEGDAGRIDLCLRERTSLLSQAGLGVGSTAVELGSMGILGTGVAGTLNTSLLTIGGGAAAPGALSAGVLAVPVVVGAVYAEAMKAEIREWDKSEQEYLTEKPEDLLAHIKEWTNRTSASSRAVDGDNSVWAFMRWMGGNASTENNRQYEEENYRRLQETEGKFNQPQREKMWKAYFMQYAPIQLRQPDLAAIDHMVQLKLKDLPSPTEAQRIAAYKEAEEHFAKEVFARVVETRLRYLRHIAAPEGNLTEQFAMTIGQADAYAELCERARVLKQNGETVLRYGVNNEYEIPLALFEITGIPSQDDQRALREATVWYQTYGKPRELAQSHIADAMRLDLLDAADRPHQEKLVRAKINADMTNLLRHEIVRGEHQLQETIAIEMMNRMIKDPLVVDAYAEVIHGQKHTEWNGLINKFTDQVLEGQAKPEDYMLLRQKLSGLLLEDAMKTYDRAKSPIKDFLNSTLEYDLQFSTPVYMNKLKALRSTHPPQPLTALLPSSHTT